MPAIFANKTKWVQLYLGVPLCSVYCFMLVIAGWPKPIVPTFLKQPKKWFEKIFHAFGAHPANEVFRGTLLDDKLKTYAIYVLGRDPNGTTKTLYATYPGGSIPEVRFFNNVRDVTLKRMLRRDLFVDPNSPQETIDKLRKNPLLPRISRFFARSKYSPHPNMDRIYVILYYETVSYKTGRTRYLVETLHHYDTATDESIYDEWPKLTFDPKLGPKIIKP